MLYPTELRAQRRYRTRRVGPVRRAAPACTGAARGWGPRTGRYGVTVNDTAAMALVLKVTLVRSTVPDIGTVQYCSTEKIGTSPSLSRPCRNVNSIRNTTA